MEKKDAAFLLLVLGGAGYAAWANWDVIAAKLGLAEFDPGLVKSIELGKKAYSFDATTENWQYLQTRAALEEIELTPDPWTSRRIGDMEFRVEVWWTERDEQVRHAFAVDVRTRIVRHEGLVEATPASPR